MSLGSIDSDWESDGCLLAVVLSLADCDSLIDALLVTDSEADLDSDWLSDWLRDSEGLSERLGDSVADGLSDLESLAWALSVTGDGL